MIEVPKRLNYKEVPKHLSYKAERDQPIDNRRVEYEQTRRRQQIERRSNR